MRRRCCGTKRSGRSRWLARRRRNRRQGLCGGSGCAAWRGWSSQWSCGSLVTGCLKSGSDNILGFCHVLGITGQKQQTPFVVTQKAGQLGLRELPLDRLVNTCRQLTSMNDFGYDVAQGNTYLLPDVIYPVPPTLRGHAAFLADEDQLLCCVNSDFSDFEGLVQLLQFLQSALFLQLRHKHVLVVRYCLTSTQTRKSKLQSARLAVGEQGGHRRDDGRRWRLALRVCGGRTGRWL